MAASCLSRSLWRASKKWTNCLNCTGSPSSHSANSGNRRLRRRRDHWLKNSLVANTKNNLSSEIWTHRKPSWKLKLIKSVVLVKYVLRNKLTPKYSKICKRSQWNYVSLLNFVPKRFRPNWQFAAIHRLPGTTASLSKSKRRTIHFTTAASAKVAPAFPNPSAR